MRTSPLILLFTLSLPLCASAESMRCGKWIVNEETPLSELLEKCGEPLRKQEKTEEVWGRNPSGAAIRTGTSKTEWWFYQQSRGSLPRVVKILDGKVVRIETGGR